MKAILTKFHGPTDTRGSRISARAEGCPVRFYSYDHASRNPHADAARQYRAERGWDTDPDGGKMVCGWLPNGDRAWVFISAVEQDII